MVSAAPLATFDTVAPMPAARSLGAITACAPAASATRRQAPRLCGSVTPSSTSSSAGPASASSRSSRLSCRRVSATRAMTPWCRPPPAKPSRRAPGTRTSFAPRLAARASRSLARASARPSSSKISMTEDGSARRRACTAWKPEMIRVAFNTGPSFGEHEIHAAHFEVHAYDAHPDAVGKPIALFHALAAQLVARGIELEVVPAQLGNVHQTLHVHTVERDEYAEAGDRGYRPLELLAHAILHVVALQPGLDLARRVVGAPLGLRAVPAQIDPAARGVALAPKHGFDRAVDQQVRVAPDGRGEMGVMLVGEAEMADVLRAVDRLAQRAH